MKHISEILLDIAQQQFIFQNRLNGLVDLVEALHQSYDVEILASMPKLEADLCVLNAMHSAINANISTSRCSAQ